MPQDARALAFFGSAGGFLAPVLTSTGAGSHVQLFSYYLLLNAGILAIAWFRSWRELNLLGFAFTFVIGSLWGWQYYRPDHFATTEPFLIAFFLFYLAIPIMFALRQPPYLKGIVDGTLVFGVPLVAFALQSAMVEDMPFGAAWSAVGCAVVYLVLASSLWRFGFPTTRLLTEAFLALGVLFTSLSVPLALDGNWTAAVWSLEGAALIWVAIRQQRLYMRAFGLLLQIGAALAFILRAAEAPAEIPVLNSACIGSLLISFGGFGVGWLYHRYRDQVSRYEAPLPRVMMIWGLFWWLAAGVNEIDRFVPYNHEVSVFLLFITLTSVLLTEPPAELADAGGTAAFAAAGNDTDMAVAAAWLSRPLSVRRSRLAGLDGCLRGALFHALPGRGQLAAIAGEALASMGFRVPGFCHRLGNQRQCRRLAGS